MGGAFVPADYPASATLNPSEALEFREGGGELVVMFGEQFVRHRHDRTGPHRMTAGSAAFGDTRVSQLSAGTR
ncbi:hypothetical protein AZG88_11175 [Rhodococcus sp. LB1]|nr:hypothetical protein AZG88_11175 [Rhodococcus sp. LB1]